MYSTSPGGAGTFTLVSVHLQLVTQYSFLDYVMGGCQINFTVREQQ